ncbi:MAG: tetratricopeptide repeat protein [Xanthomonadales bacterium]
MLPAVGVYAAGCWVLIEILDRLVDRYLLSPYITDAAFWGLYSLIPAVIMVTWSHGKPGKDRVTRLEKIGVPINIIATLGLLIAVFGGKDMGAMASAVTVANEEGVAETHYVPNESYRRRMAVFFFDNESGDPEQDWLQYAVTELLVQDLQQNPFVLATSPWANYGNGFYARMRAAGFEDGLDVPRSLMREIATDANRQYFLEGSIVNDDEPYRIDVRIWETDSLRQVAELSRSGYDLYGLVDDLSRDVRSALDVPAGGARLAEDLPLTETYGESQEALKDYIAGLNARLFSNDIDAANRLLSQALDADPGFVLAWFVKAINLLDAGDIPAAQEALVQAQELDYRLPERDQILIKQAAYRLSGQQDKMLKLLRLQVQLYGDAAAYSRLAFMLQVTGQPEAAKEQYQAALEKDPLNLGIYLALANLERATGDRDAAVAYARRYQQEKPEDDSAHIVLGDLLRDSGDLEAAEEQYVQASLLANEPVDALLRLADLAARRGKETEARALLQQADESTRIPLGKGLVRQAAATLETRLGRIRDALEQLRLQHEYLSQSVAPYEVALATYVPMANLFVELGDTPRARAALETARETIQPPLDQFLAFSMANILIEEGDLDAAEAELVKGEAVIEQFKLEDVRTNVDMLRARIRSERKDYVGAAALFQSAQARIERSVIAGNDVYTMLPSLYALIARALVQAGEPERAEAALEEGFELDPTNPHLWMERARYQQATGAPALAQASVNFALAVWKDADPDYRYYRQATALAAELGLPQ